MKPEIIDVKLRKIEIDTTSDKVEFICEVATLPDIDIITAYPGRDPAPVKDTTIDEVVQLQIWVTA